MKNTNTFSYELTKEVRDAVNAINPAYNITNGDVENFMKERKISEMSISENKSVYQMNFRAIFNYGERRRLKSVSTKIKIDKGRNKKKSEAEAVIAGRKMYIAIIVEMIISNFEIPAVTPNMPFFKLIERHIDNKKIIVQATTYNGYVHMFEKHMKPFFEKRDTTVGNVKLEDIVAYQSYLKEAEISNNTAIKHLTLMKSACSEAVNNSYMAISPFVNFRMPKRKKPKHDYFTTNEMHQLARLVYYTEELEMQVEAAQGNDKIQLLHRLSRIHKLKMPIILALYFALRRSEIIGLKWDNIDLDNKEMYIVEKVTRQKQDDGTIRDIATEELKTEESEAVYYLNDEITEILRAEKEEQLRKAADKDIPYTFSGYVCVDEIGDRLKLDYISDAFPKLLDENGMRVINFHGLRHSVITYLFDNVSQKGAQVYARHSTFNITSDTYAHAALDSRKVSIDAISGILGLNIVIDEAIADNSNASDITAGNNNDNNNTDSINVSEDKAETVSSDADKLSDLMNAIKSGKTDGIPEDIIKSMSLLENFLASDKTEQQ